MEKIIIYTTYSEETDMTFILKDVFMNDDAKSTEVIGFYFGTPNDKSTIAYIGKLKAEF